MTKKIIGSLVIVLGLIGVILSIYIKAEVARGKVMVKGAEKTVKEGKGLFGLTPATKEIGKGFTKGAEKKIESGKEKISKYEKLANWTLGGGIVVIILGSAILLRKK